MQLKQNSFGHCKTCVRKCPPIKLYYGLLPYPRGLNRGPPLRLATVVSTVILSSPERNCPNDVTPQQHRARIYSAQFLDKHVMALVCAPASQRL